MKYPNITIKVHDYVPTLEYQSAEGISRQMFKLDIGLDTLLMQVADSIDFSGYKDVSDILEFIRVGDETFVDFGPIDLGREEMKAAHIVAGLEQVIVHRPQPQPELSNELNVELRRNWQSDVLASVLEEVYAILIAYAVFNASELGLNVIVLDDNKHEVRLREKLGKELLIVPEIELLVI